MKRAAEVLAQRSIRSPVNGLVVQIPAAPGRADELEPEKPIMKVAEVDRLRLRNPRNDIPAGVKCRARF